MTRVTAGTSRWRPCSAEKCPWRRSTSRWWTFRIKTGTYGLKNFEADQNDTSKPFIRGIIGYPNVMEPGTIMEPISNGMRAAQQNRARNLNLWVFVSIYWSLTSNCNYKSSLIYFTRSIPLSSFTKVIKNSEMILELSGISDLWRYI